MPVNNYFTSHLRALAGVFEEERILNEDYVAAKCVPEGPIQTEVTEDPFRGKRFNGVAMVWEDMLLFPALPQ